jgi:lipopolysaccharide heptosyltransferase II
MMLGDIGDILLATPALRRLRDAYPDATITAMTKPTTIAALARSGLVDDYLPIEKHIFDRPRALLRPAVLWELLRYVRGLRRRRFDTVVLLHHLVTAWGTMKFALLTLATGAPVRAGLDNGRGLFLTHAARDLGFDAAHETEYWLRVVDALTAPARTPHPMANWPLGCGRRSSAPLPDAREGENLPTPTFIVPDTARAAAGGLLREGLREVGLDPDGPLLAIHPGSGAYSVARRWYPERFAAVADSLSERHGLGVVVVGTADERALADEVLGHMRRPGVNLAGRTSLDELGGVLRRCALLVGNDSGVGHLASAVGTPVVAVFGPFNHHTWRPLGRSVVVRATPALPCMPCVNRGFSRGYPEGCPPRYCLQEVTPPMVVAAAEDLLVESRKSKVERGSG